MAKRPPAVVDAYIAKQPPKSQAILQRVRRIIRKTLPCAQETISYQIPTYKVDDRAVVYFAGWKEHWSLYPVTDVVRAILGTEADSYVVRKGTMRFPLTDPVPTGLVERIVKELARVAEGRRAGKARTSGGLERRRRRTRR